MNTNVSIDPLANDTASDIQAPSLSPERARLLTVAIREQQYTEARAALSTQAARVEQARQAADERIAEQCRGREKQLAIARARIEEINIVLADAQTQVQQMQAHAGNLGRRFDVEPAMAEADAVIHGIAGILGDASFGADLLDAADPIISTPTTEETATAQQAVATAITRVEEVQFELLEAEERLETLQTADTEQRAQEKENLALIRTSVEQALDVLTEQRKKLETDFADIGSVIREREAEQQAAVDELCNALQAARSEAEIGIVLAGAREKRVLHLVSNPAAQRRRELKASIRDGIAFATTLPTPPDKNVLAVVTPDRQVHTFQVNATAKGLPKTRIFAFAQKVGGQVVSVAGDKTAPNVRHSAVHTASVWSHWKSWQLLDTGSREIGDPFAGQRRRKSAPARSNGRRRAPNGRKPNSRRPVNFDNGGGYALKAALEQAGVA